MNRSELVRLIARDFATEEDFDELLFELDLGPGQIPGRNIPAKARELLTHMERRGKDGELLAAIAALRPHLQPQLETYDGWRPGIDIGLKKGGVAGGSQQVTSTTQTDSTSTTPAESKGDYANFDIRIDMKQENGYPVYAEASYGNKSYGETGRKTLQLLPSDHDFQDQMDYLRDLRSWAVSSGREHSTASWRLPLRRLRV
jgi:hypothetical protein